VKTEKNNELKVTSSELHDEQQSRKQLERQLTELQESHAEITAAKHNSETVRLIMPSCTVSK